MPSFRSLLLLLLLIQFLISAPVMTWIPPYAVGTCKANLETPAVQNALTHLSLQFWVPDGPNVAFSEHAESNGGEQFNDALIREIRDTARAHGIKTMLCIFNNTESKKATEWSDADEQGWSWMMGKNSFITNKTAFIASLIAEMKRFDLDGIEIDIEGPGSSSGHSEFLTFMRELSTAVRAEGKELTVATFASDWGTPGPNEWSALLPYVDALTSMGYQEIGRNASGSLSYSSQVSLASAAPEKFMLGMPSWEPSWPAGSSSNTAQEQVNWVKSHGVAGMAIWDLQLSNSAWATSNSIWSTIGEIRGALPTHPEMKTLTGPAASSTERKPTFSWSATDPDGTVEKYYYSMDNATPTTMTTNTSYTVPTDLSYGNHTFYVQAEDNVGNKSDIKSFSFYVSDGTGGANLLVNGDFSDGTTKWVFRAHSDVFAEGSATVVNGEYVMQMTRTGPYWYNGNAGQSGFQIENGKMYELTFDAKASAATKFHWGVQENGGNWTGFGGDSVTLSTAMTNYRGVFYMEEATETNSFLTFAIGKTTSRITLDNVVLREIPISGTHTITATAGAEGTITPSGAVQVIDGLNKTFTISSKDPVWSPLADVKIDGVSKGPISSYTFENVTTNHTIQAIFDTKTKYTITTIVEGAGSNSISPSGVVEVPEGTNKAFSISAGSSGFSVLQDVIVDGVSKGPITSYSFSDIAANHTIKAVYTGTPVTSDMIEWGHWNASVDAHNSLLDTGAALISNGVAKADFNLRATNSLSKIYTWGQVDCQLPVGAKNNLVGVTHIIIRYRVSEYSYLVLYDPTVIDGGSYRKLLPKSSSFITDTISVSSFGQPSWVIDQKLGKPFNPSNVTGIVVNVPGDEGYSMTASIEIDELRLLNYQGSELSLKLTEKPDPLDAPTTPTFGWETKGGNGTYYYSIDSKANFTATTAKTALFSNLTEGTHTFYLYGTDSKGNATDTIEYEFNVVDPTGNVYTITTAFDGQGSFLPAAPITVKHGEDIQITMVPDAGFGVSFISTREKVGANYDSTSTYTFRNVQKDDTIYAHFVSIDTMFEISISPATYAHVTPGADEQGNVHDSVKLGEDSEVYTITTDSGYALAWYLTTDGVKVYDDNTIQIKNVRRDHSIGMTVYPTYDVTSSATGGSIIPEGITAVMATDSIQYTYAPDPGYRFKEVMVDGVANRDSTSSFTIKRASKPHTIQAVFEKIPSFEVTSSVTGNGTITPLGTQTVAENGTVQFTYAAVNGHRLKSVLIDGAANVDSLTSYTFSNVTANHTIAVEYEKIPDNFEITATAIGNGTITPAGVQSVVEGTSLQFTYAPVAEHRIKSVLIDGVANVDSLTSFTFNNVAANHTITVEYEKIPATFEITASATGNGTITPVGVQSVVEGEALQFTFAAEQGYRLKSLLVDGVANVDSTVSYTFTAVAANHTIAVEFEEVPATLYTITASVDGNGSVTPAGAKSVFEGDSQQFVFAPATGHRLDSITVDGVRVDSTASYTFAAVNADHTVKGFFSPIPTVTITATVSGSGTITPEGSTVLYAGSNQIYTFVPAAGSKLDSVLVDGAPVAAGDSYSFVNVTANHTIAAYFSAVPTFTITASAVGGGAITPAGATVVAEGGSQVYTITAPENVVFDSLLVDGAPVVKDVTYTFMNVLADATIVAYFTDPSVAVVEAKQNRLNLAIANAVWTQGSSDLPVIQWGRESRELRTAEVKLFDAVGNKLLNMTVSASDIASGATVLPLADRVYGSGQYLLIVAAETLEGEMKLFKAAIGVKR